MSALKHREQLNGLISYLGLSSAPDVSSILVCLNELELFKQVVLFQGTSAHNH